MSQTLYNGAVVPTNSDAYDITGDLVDLCLSLNVPIPVTTLAQRNGLAALAPGGVLPIGTMVLRRDQSMFTEKWDGTTWKTSAHSEWTRSGQVVPSTQVWGVGALTVDAAKSTDTAFVTHPAANQLKFRDAGTYAITFIATSSASLTGRAFVEIQSGATPLIRTVVTGEDRGAAIHPNYRAAANEVLVFDVYHESGADRTLGFRIAVTRTA